MNSEYENKLQNTPTVSPMDKLKAASRTAVKTIEETPYQPIVYAIPKEDWNAFREWTKQAVTFQPTLYQQIAELTTRQEAKETARIHSKMLEQTSRCLAEQAGGGVDRLDGGNAQSPCGKRQHLRRGGRWKGAYQQTKSDQVPCYAGWREESYDSTTAKTTCGVQAGRKAIKSKGMVSRCA